MRLAVLSDIHGNLEAFREVLDDLDCQQVDIVVSLGDNIGYGPEPEAVLRLLRARRIPSICGNHEKGIADPSFLSWFNNSARRSLDITRELLSDESILFSTTLKPTLVVNGCLLVHGCPPDSINTYLFELSDEQVKDLIVAMEQSLCFVGHTHELSLASFDGKEVRRSDLEEGFSYLPEGWKFIINTGSVGQPRDRDKRAKAVIWDDVSRLLEVRCVPYDIAKTAQRILDLGFPDINAKRLW